MGRLKTLDRTVANIPQFNLLSSLFRFITAKYLNLATFSTICNNQ